MAEPVNAISPRVLAVVVIRRHKDEALHDAEVSEYGSAEYVFFQRLAELLQDAAAFLASKVDPPE